MKSKKTPLLLVALLLATFSLQSCSTAMTGSSSSGFKAVPFVGSLQVKKTQLSNGLKLLVVEDPSSPTFAYQTWYRVGSKHEVPGYTGLAHLFEHMMFKGTKTLKDGEFDKILESAGAEGENAFTSRDYTVYVQEMPKDKLDLIAKLEADRMVNLVVDEKAFKTEREVVQNERRFRYENSPDGIIYQEIFGLAFQKHSYKWPVIGYEEDLNRMSNKDAEAFYKNYYSPDRATVVVIGDVIADEVLKTVKKYYGSIQPQKTVERDIPVEPDQKSPRKKTMKLNLQVQKLMMAYRVTDSAHPDVPTINLLRSVLSSGRSSRLEKALVDSGVASSQGMYDLDDKDPSLLIFNASLQKGRKSEEAEKIILKEIEKLQTQLVPDTELEKAKNQLAFEFYNELSDSNEQAHFLGLNETINGDFTKGLETIEHLSSIQAKDLREVAQKYLKPEQRSVIYGVQK